MPKIIQLKTAIPGPRSLALLEERNRFVPKGIFNSTPLFVERASGAVIKDVDGNIFIDFAGGIGTMNVGHCNAEVLRAATEQMNRATHTCFIRRPSWHGCSESGSPASFIIPARRRC